MGMVVNAGVVFPAGGIACAYSASFLSKIVCKI